MTFGHVKEKSAGHYLYIARTFSQEKSFVFVILSESFLPHTISEINSLT